MSADDSQRVKRGMDLRRQARRAFGQAVLLTELSAKQADDTIRRALNLVASAYNWLEDTEFDNATHREMHKYGRYAREHFPDRCELGWTSSGYEERCPIAVGHKRLGFSIGFIGDRICSICQADPSECEHIAGEFYEIKGGSDHRGFCQVCGVGGCADHLDGSAYQVIAARRIANAQIQEVSLVDKPVHPDARLLAIPIDFANLRRVLGPRFQPGQRVSCDMCLEACPGMDRPLADGTGAHA